MTTLHDIGDSLRRYRKRYGLTLSALAEKSNIHRNTLSALENGSGNVELNTLLAVCDQLGLDLVPTPARVAGFVRQEASLPEPAGVSAFSRETGQWPPGITSPERPAPDLTALQKRISSRLASVKLAEDREAPPMTRLQNSLARARDLLAASEPRQPETTALQKRISARLASTARPNKKEPG